MHKRKSPATQAFVAASEGCGRTPNPRTANTTLSLGVGGGRLPTYACCLGSQACSSYCPPWAFSPGPSALPASFCRSPPTLSFTALFCGDDGTCVRSPTSEKNLRQFSSTVNRNRMGQEIYTQKRRIEGEEAGRVKTYWSESRTSSRQWVMRRGGGGGRFLFLLILILLAPSLSLDAGRDDGDGEETTGEGANRRDGLKFVAISSDDWGRWCAILLYISHSFSSFCFFLARIRERDALLWSCAAKCCTKGYFPSAWLAMQMKSPADQLTAAHTLRQLQVAPWASVARCPDQGKLSSPWAMAVWGGTQPTDCGNRR
jgi:hypothetical protein